MTVNALPGVGRMMHYVSKLEPYVESPATITGTTWDWLGLLPGAANVVNNLGESLEVELADGYTTERHASMQVQGLVTVYPEWNIPYSGPVGTAGEFKLPGTWHWWDECGTFNDHIERR